MKENVLDRIKTKKMKIFHSVLCVSGSPKGIEFNSVKEVLLSVKAVKSMHSLHLWALTLGQALVSVHLAIGTPTIFVLFYLLVNMCFTNYCRTNIFNCDFK